MLRICGSDALALRLEAWKPVSVCGSRAPLWSLVPPLWGELSSQYLTGTAVMNDTK